MINDCAFLKRRGMKNDITSFNITWINTCKRLHKFNDIVLVVLNYPQRPITAVCHDRIIR